MEPQRFLAALAAFDEANRADPNRETFEGEDCPKELLYSMRMTAWLDRLEPNASEALRLAARSQHLCRWMIPRSSYSMDRQGYRRWRTDLGKFHADRAGEIMRSVGYDQDTIDRVQSLLRKENLRDDPEMQLLEDVICLVFLESYFAEFSQKHDEEKILGIIRKTWRKMSARGQAAALGLDLSPRERELVEKAVS